MRASLFVDEFKCSNFIFNVGERDHNWVHQFGESVWFRTRWLYVLWRLLMLLLIIVAFSIELSTSISDGLGDWFPIYLTNTTLMIELSYLILAFVLSVNIYFQSPDPSNPQPFLSKFVWWVQSIVHPSALAVTLLFWTLVYKGGSVRQSTIWAHVVNSLVVVMDLLVSAFQTRLLHYVWALMYCVTYIVWSVIHYFTNIGDGLGDRYIYSALNWSPSTTKTAVLTCVIIVVIVAPLCVLVLWFICLIRDRCSHSGAFKGDRESSFETTTMNIGNRPQSTSAINIHSEVNLKNSTVTANYPSSSIPHDIEAVRHSKTQDAKVPPNAGSPHEISAVKFTLYPQLPPPYFESQNSFRAEASSGGTGPTFHPNDR